MADEKKETAAPASKGGSGILGLVLPAVLAGAAAFGGAKLAGAHVGGTPAAAESAQIAAKPPGPTLSLDPFLVNTVDANKKIHPMKVTLAIEFDTHTKEDSLKPLIPRIRDASLSYFRTITFEEATDTQHSDKLRAELLERYRTSGAAGADRVLVTDLVVQ